MDLSKIDDYKRLFMRVAAAECPGFSVLPEQRETVNDIFRWCMMLDGKHSPDKGLWLYGNIGTGKSTMLRIVKEFCKMVRPPGNNGRIYSFAIVNAVDICARFSARGFPGIEDYIGSSRLAIDELGSEVIPTGYYGTPLNVIQHLLQGRYDRKHSSFTHVTTNISLKQISSMYSPRIYDRCKEMFNFVEFKGKTFRKETSYGK